LYAPSAPLVVVMDMSSHMLAADLQPSRVLRERLKVEQLIAQRKGGQLGLVAYAGDAFTVAPLSDDPESLRDLLAALAPDTMPVDGQRADLAIARAAKLLSQAGYAHGQILLLSDTADAAAQDAARAAFAKGYTVDAIGIGTAAGAPLPSTDGTFAQDARGGMQVARLDASALRMLASDGGGGYADLRSDANDLANLGLLDSKSGSDVHRGDAESLRWRDDGPFLLLALLPLAALGFRRGWLAVALLAILLMPAQPAAAAEPNWWNSLWQRSDQRADHALRTNDAKAASALAQTPDQRAAAAYRNGDFASAAREWAAGKDADANYNRGNALAQMKHFPQAVDAYKRALQSNPQMADAQVNLKLVQQLLRKQQQQQQQGGQQKNQQQKNGQQGQQNQQQASQKGEQKPDQNGQSKNQENMQQSHQQAQQQGQQPSKNPQANQQPAPKPGEQDKNQQASAQQGEQQEGKDKQQAAPQQPAPDQAAQAKADAAQQHAMQQALQKTKQGDDKPKQSVAVARESNAQREKREAIESLLQRVPDDPGGLLRAKFALEYARRQQENNP
jgi:Ca-activated chloride channel family protein